MDQIFDYLLKDKQIKLPEDHKIPSTEKLKGKWHNWWSHNINNYLVFRNVIQKSIIEDGLKFSDKDKSVMLINGDPFPEVTIDTTSTNLINLGGDHNHKEHNKLMK